MKAAKRILVILLAPMRLAAQPCFDPVCCFSPAAAPVPCAALGADCYGVDGLCFSLMAMWWDPTVQQGLGVESGVHLRWAFNLAAPDVAGADHATGLTYPRGGFEIQRRQHQATGGYQTIAPRVYPATNLLTAIARIPSSVQTSDLEAYDAYTGDLDCDGRQDILDLIAMLRRATCLGQGYTTFWWVEGSKEADGTPQYWSDPLVTEGVDLHPFIAYERDFFAMNGRHPMTYQFKPLELLHIAASDPVIARILGLYYVDTTAMPGVQYDYRVIAHYVSLRPGFHLRYCAEAADIGSGTVRAVPNPGVPRPVVASLQALLQEKVSDLAASETVVQLQWTNYLRDVLDKPGPDAPLVAADGIPPLNYLLWRDDLGDTPGFQRLTRLARHCGETVTVRVPPVLIGSKPNPAGEDAPALWKDPPYYRDGTVQTNHKYKYQVRGVDIFGRYSAAAESEVIKVVDQVPPPAPIVTEAVIFQTGDPVLQRLPAEDAVKVKVLAAKSSIVLRVRWLWPESFREPLERDDLKEFRVVAVAGAALREVRTVPGNALAEEYEVYIGLDPFGLVVEPSSEADPVNGRVRILEVAVRAFDTTGNGSTIGRLWKTAVRDVTPPPTPASPYSLREPGPPDPEGRAAIALEWSAEKNLTYLLYRAGEREICEGLGVEPEDCSVVLDGALADWAEAHFEIFQPVVGAARLGTFADRVPGLARSRFFYVLRAMDPAGNASSPSPLSERIIVEDGFAPPKPIIASAFGDAGGQIRIEWLPNTDTDVHYYRLYRTEVFEHRTSKRKMVLEWTEDTTDPDDTEVTAAGRFRVINAPPTPELTQYYRLEAEDFSRNVSILSEAAAARTVDHSPPEAPAWLRGTPFWACVVGVPQVFAMWTTPRSAVEFRLLRRQAVADDEWGAWQDLTGWLGPGHNFHEDAAADPSRRYQYRVEARDGAGNATHTDATVEPAGELCSTLFVRGDANADGGRDLSDAVRILNVLFLGVGEIPCEEAANANGDEQVDISDALYLLNYLFRGDPSPPPPPPFPECGLPGLLLLGCEAFPPCE